MSAPTLEYNLHDAVVLTTEFEEVGRMTLHIRLYKIYYPEEPTVKLTISGIVNTNEVKAFGNEITKQSGKRGWLGYRIDAFKRVDEQRTEADWVQLWLSVDHLKPLRIRCRKYHFSKVDG